MIRQRLATALPTLVVLMLTLTLMGFVGYGEAKRTYSQFQANKLITQGEVVRNRFEPFLLAGLPLDQFSGFDPLADSLLQSDPALTAIRIVDRNDNVVFERKTDHPTTTAAFHNSNLSIDSNDCLLEENGQEFRASLPLADKFGPAGRIEVLASQKLLFSPMQQAYRSVLYAALLITALVAIFMPLLLSPSGTKTSRLRRYEAAFTIAFSLMATAVGYTVYDIYEDGAQARTRALASSMGHRLQAVMDLDIELKDIAGLEEAFTDYKDNNPAIRSIALVENGISRIDTDADNIGLPWRADEDTYDYRVALIDADNSQRYAVAVTLPSDVVVDAIFSGAKNFIVLFVACGLIALVFLDTGAGLMNRPENGDHDYQTQLKLVKPTYFLIVFVSAMSVPFLPQVIEQMASQTHSEFASASLPFTAYYALFALSLIPAGRYAERGKLKNLMAVGFIAEVIGMSMVALTDDYWLLTIGRCASGIGQGSFLIGLQSYLVSVTPKEKRTLGNAVKVNGRNAGLIAGTAIGALLFSYLDYRSVFIIASALTLLGILFLWTFVPHAKEIPVGKPKCDKGVSAVVTDGEFMRTLLFVGLASKITITGVVMFAVPLILSRADIAAEDIGLSLMLFYIASIIATRSASNSADRDGNTRRLLFLSTVNSALGLVFLGLVTSALMGTAMPFDHPFLHQVWPLLQNAESALYPIMICLLLLGWANGQMAAPVLTHISRTNAAEALGSRTVTATYLFLERGGHVIGPMTISFLLAFYQESTFALILYGGFTLLLGALFLLTSRQKKSEMAVDQAKTA